MSADKSGFATTALVAALAVTAGPSLARALSGAAGPASSGSMALHMQISPLEGLAGGAILASAAVARLATTGRLLGVSGVLRGMLGAAGRQTWRLAFLGGTLLGGALISRLLPGAFEPLGAGFTLARAVGGGLLVGLGTAMANGCTSGHGICGNSRLSPRSMLATVTFMFAGGVTAIATGTAVALGVAPNVAATLALPALDAAAWTTIGGAAAAAGVLLVAADAAARAAWAHASSPLDATGSRAEALGEVLYGAVFALGLGVGGMTRPTKVAAFLSLGKPFWDPSLMAVMGGALAVAAVGFRAALALRRAPALGGAYQIPSGETFKLDGPLMLGSTLFGAGWGLTGICPGPLLVNLASPFADEKHWAFLAAMLAAMALHERFLAPQEPPPLVVAGVTNVDEATAKALLRGGGKSGPPATYVDIRDGHELQCAGCIPGAVHIVYQYVDRVDEKKRTPNPAFISQMQARFPDKSAPLLLGCRIGNRSAHAAAALQAAGYTNVTNLAAYCMHVKHWRPPAPAAAPAVGGPHAGAA